MDEGLSKTQTLPIFSLPVAVLPGELLPLHIFEDRYQSMVASCMESIRSGGVPEFGVCFIEGDKRVAVGCAVEITRIAKRYGDGRLDIEATATRRFRVLREIDGESFPQAEIQELIDANEEVEVSLRERAAALSRKLEELRVGSVPMRELVTSVPLSYGLALQSGLEMVQKQRLLEMESENQRLMVLIEFYRKLIGELAGAVELRTKVASNGHFKKQE